MNGCDPEKTTLKELKLSLEEKFPSLQKKLSSAHFKPMVINEIQSCLFQKLSSSGIKSPEISTNTNESIYVNDQTNSVEQMKKDRELAIELFKKESFNNRSRRTTTISSSKRPIDKSKKAKVKTNNPSNFPLLNTSPQLSLLLDGRTQVTSAEAVKLIWQYIKKEDLQDPSDRRYILSDTKLSGILDGRCRIHMFHLSKYLQNHLYKE